MTRRFASLAAAAAAVFLAAACGSPPTPKEADLNAAGSHPGVLAGGATDETAPPEANQADTQVPGGPVSDQSGAQSDTTGSR